MRCGGAVPAPIYFGQTSRGVVSLNWASWSGGSIILWHAWPSSCFTNTAQHYRCTFLRASGDCLRRLCGDLGGGICLRRAWLLKQPSPAEALIQVLEAAGALCSEPSPGCPEVQFAMPRSAPAVSRSALERNYRKWETKGISEISFGMGPMP